MPETPVSQPARATPVPAVHLAGASKRFGARWALREVDLRVEAGESVAVVGPNGAGKTTLLRMLATLVAPSSGEVRVFGRSVRGEADEVRRRTGLLSRDGYLYGELTGAENLRFATLMCGRRPEAGRIRRALEGVGLEDAADLRVRAYSDGMRKRLELARLLLRRTDLLLLDEPYAGLDAEGTRLVDETLERARSEGATALFASHRGGEAGGRADRIVLLVAGRVVADGPPGAVREELRRRGMEGLVGLP